MSSGRIDGRGCGRLAGVADTPVRVFTPAGPLDLRWENQSIFLVGPAELIGTGEYFWKGNQTK